MKLHLINRRKFVTVASSLVAGYGLASGTQAAPPTVKRPRATDGDDRFEPNWDKRLTLTVGQKKGDLVGQDDKVVQAAVDYMARMGGGTVKLLPGKYVFRNAVHLPSRIRLLGSGPESIITKIPSRNVPLTADSDWYDQEITLKDARGFQVGDGVVLRTKNPHNGSTDVIKRTLVAQSGNRFKLNDGRKRAKILERLVALRVKLFGLPYGDQALLISRDFYREIGGFKPVPLMEDVDIVRRIGRRRLVRLPLDAITSAERYHRDGYLWRSARNLFCLSLYFFGVPPRIIVKLYG